MKTLFHFTANIVTGSGRGKGMGTPTLNLDLADVPKEMEEGIYVCKVRLNDQSYNAAMHYGPRPVHKDTRSCEVHILDTVIEPEPEPLTVDVITYLRPVLDFPSEAALIAQIGDDIEKTRGILEAYDQRSEETRS